MSLAIQFDVNFSTSKRKFAISFSTSKDMLVKLPLNAEICSNKAQRSGFAIASTISRYSEAIVTSFTHISFKLCFTHKHHKAIFDVVIENQIHM
ncbi:hypothetical protein YC2023_016199 [Brassica napus]